MACIRGIHEKTKTLEAKKSEHLKCFLQKLALKKPRRHGNPRPLQTVAKRAQPKLPHRSHRRSAEIKQDAQFEGIGRLSPLASECVYDDEDSSVLSVTGSRKRTFQHMGHWEVDEASETKRPRLASTIESRVCQDIVSSCDAHDLEDWEDDIPPSGQCQDLNVIGD